MKLSLLLAAASLAAVCVSAVPAAAAPSFDLGAITTATQADLSAAKADADAHGDTLASQCYAAAADYVASNPIAGVNVGPVVGVASAFQDARDAVKTAQAVKAQFAGGIPKPILIGCGPLALDVQSDLGRAASDFTLLGIRF